MPRNARCVAPAHAYHVTQRGNNQQDVFYTQRDRDVYLDLVRQQLRDSEVSVLGYCLMTNHVHWVVIANRTDSLAVLFRRVNGRYSQYLNVRRGNTGHIWQGRFFSCMLDPGRIWIALRYIENNPVRAGIVDRVEGYPWSSGRQHLTGKFPRNSLLDQAFWRDNGGVQNWKDLIGVPAPLSLEERELRRCTFGGQPFGDEQFVSGMELAFNRKWPRRPPLTEGETADAAEA